MTWKCSAPVFSTIRYHNAPTLSSSSTSSCLWQPMTKGRKLRSTSPENFHFLPSLSSLVFVLNFSFARMGLINGNDIQIYVYAWRFAGARNVARQSIPIIEAIVIMGARFARKMQIYQRMDWFGCTSYFLDFGFLLPSGNWDANL